jgi:hypothetical protein
MYIHYKHTHTHTHTHTHRRQQEEDLLLLNAMLDKERQAEEAEIAYKAVLKKQASSQKSACNRSLSPCSRSLLTLVVWSPQAREYQAQLIELMKKEAVDEAASEAIRQAEQVSLSLSLSVSLSLSLSLSMYVYVCA